MITLIVENHRIKSESWKRSWDRTGSWINNQTHSVGKIAVSMSFSNSWIKSINRNENLFQ